MWQPPGIHTSSVRLQDAVGNPVIGGSTLTAGSGYTAVVANVASGPTQGVTLKVVTEAYYDAMDDAQPGTTEAEGVLASFPATVSAPGAASTIRATFTADAAWAGDLRFVLIEDDAKTRPDPANARSWSTAGTYTVA